MTHIDEVMKNLAEYTRIQEEAAAVVEALRDEIKQYMQEKNTDTITGAEHKATFKAYSSSRIDTTALKADHPEIAAAYTKTTETRRFIFK